jgi:hypothetical protein
MRVGADPAAKKRKRRRGGRKRDRLRRKDNDPLQSFEGPKGGDEDGEADDGGGHSDGSDGEDPIAEKGEWMGGWVWCGAEDAPWCGWC